MLFTVWAAMGYFQRKLQPALGSLDFPELCEVSRADTSMYAVQTERKVHHWCYVSEFVLRETVKDTLIILL